jgi:ABC-2 type transport system permease protein
MNKIFAIGIKDLQLIFRDRAALLLMLLAPFLITFGMGFVSGAFEADNGNAGISDIPVMIINRDEGTLGSQLVSVFESDGLADLLDLVEAQPEADARISVNEDELAAVVIIPADFSAAMFPNPETGEVLVGEQIEIYRSPSRPVSVSVIEAVVDSFLNQVDSNIVFVQVTIDQLEADGQLEPAMIGQQVGQLLSSPAATAPSESLISINQHSGSAAGAEESDFNILSILAPGMALFFLMYTVTLGGRSILHERRSGTLARMQTTATNGAQILSGKVFGIFLTGLIQVAILVIGSTLLYNLQWGDWFGLLVLISSAAAAATGWGLLFASSLQTPEQVTGVGSAVMLTFGAISGTFVQIDNAFINGFGAITPNQWALQGFRRLGLGQSLVDILPNIGALWLMAIVLFTISVVMFRRQNN